MRALEILKKYYGYSNFRKGQQEIINEIILGNDVLSIMPTGAGKSICYQIPALIFDGITIVISPLISLMKDQVDSLKHNGINAAFINSTLDKNEQLNILYGIKNNEYKIIYVAPERLTANDFINAINAVTVSQIAIDEAHCVSSWGHDFRVSYRNISQFINTFKERPIVTAFTATASLEVREDIINLLKLNNPKIILQGFDRQNLKITINKGINKNNYIYDYLNKNRNVSGIIYCITRREVESLASELLRRGFKASSYHGGLSDKERKKNQEDFINDKTDVMVATNAFGMGIDKPDIRFVIHNNMPQTIEGYYQEIGRAGRDGEESECILLFSPADVQMQKFLIDSGINDINRKNIYYKKLQDITSIVYSNDCYRKQILNYFGDSFDGECGNCSNCLSQGEKVDRTIDAQKVISCIYKMKRSFGIGVLVDVLRGSKNKKILDFEFDKLSTYGIMKEYKKEKLVEFINILISHGFISQEEGDYPVLKINNNSIKIIKGELKVILKEVVVNERVYELNELFDILRELRREISIDEKVPPYIIFGDRTLKDMCNSYPINKDEFLKIQGVGKAKYEKYGERFIETIREYMVNNNISKSNIISSNDTSLVLNVTSDTELFLKLKSLRDLFAKKQGRVSYSIISKDTLLEISGRYPLTLDELKDIKGLGPKKLSEYGNEILSIVKDYVDEFKVNRDWKYKGKSKVIIDGEDRTHQEIAVHMLQDGYTVKDVFDKIEVSTSTILGYVTDYIKSSGDISFNLNLNQYYNDIDKKLIIDACEKHGIENINNLKKILPSNINYDTIRAVILSKYYNIA